MNGELLKEKMLFEMGFQITDKNRCRCQISGCSRIILIVEQVIIKLLKPVLEILSVPNVEKIPCHHRDFKGLIGTVFS